MGTVSSHFASGLTNSTSSPDGCFQDAQFAPNRYTFAELPFSCVSEANGADFLPSSSFSNDTDFAMENCSFKRRMMRSSASFTSPFIVVLFATTKSARRPRFCFRDETPVVVRAMILLAAKAAVVMLFMQLFIDPIRHFHFSLSFSLRAHTKRTTTVLQKHRHETGNRSFLFFVCVSTREEVEEKSPQNVTHVSSLRHHHHHHHHHQRR